MTRSVLFDTETTGLDPMAGDRIIEIAAIELIGDLPTGAHFHALVDPKRGVPDDAVRIHGITAAMLQGKPEFSEIADGLLAFFGDGALIAHNAAFDFGFLDAEFDRIGYRRLDRARMVDTLAMAKLRYPGLPNNLDALCRRFDIDLSQRSTHNALLDCRLLSEVYVALTGGRQRGLDLGDDVVRIPDFGYRRPEHRQPVAFKVTEAQLAAHAAFLARCIKNPIWLTN